MKLYLSTDATITTADNITAHCTQTSIPSVPSTIFSEPFTVHLKLHSFPTRRSSDLQNQVAESDESNNTLVASNTTVVSAAQLTDLVVTSVTFPASVTNETGTAHVSTPDT